MRIVVWNLQGGAQEKMHHLRSLEPDIAIIPECKENVLLEDGESLVWSGDPAQKGLAVIATGGRTLTKVADPTEDELRIMPVEVGGTDEFRLLAVWSDNDPEAIKAREQPPVIGPLRRSLIRHKAWLRAGPSVVAGDFNHNAVWDVPLYEACHSYAVADLKTFGLSSAYHRHLGCEQGAEPDPTFYLYKAVEKGAHIDYAFVPDAWRVDNVTVASYDKFCRLVADGGVSDHAPLTVDVTPTPAVG